MTAVNILVDANGKTVGATLCDNFGNVRVFSTSELVNLHNEIKLSNAVITQDGFVRSKHGTLPKISMNMSPSAIVQNEQAKAKKLATSNTMIVYHGTKNDHLVPKFGAGKSDNDYGSGFYTTPDHELAKEWAWSFYTVGGIGYCYKYEIDTDKLNILNLTLIDPIHWIAELVYYRELELESRIDIENRERLLNRYKLDTELYDIIIGYRADDRYFKYATLFVQGRLYMEEIGDAMRLGSLGLQVMIKSRKAFTRIKQIGDPEIVPEKYKEYYNKRDSKARRGFDIIMNRHSMQKPGRRIHDYIKESS